ncbi:MAG: chemotaxis protein CheB, partial [Sphingopyxis sp.]
MGAPFRITRPRAKNAGAPEPAAVRVMLVDDSIIARSILERIIDHAPGFAVVASVPSAKDALARLNEISVDIVVLDIEMPGMSGLAALPLILARGGDVRVIILSAMCKAGGPAAIEALSLGASDTLVKPGKGSFSGRFSEVLIERLRALGHGADAKATADQLESSLRDAEQNEAPAHDAAICAPLVDGAGAVAPVAGVPAAPLAAIAIGASTGGIVAINQFLDGLGAHVLCPIFITQHLPAGFITFFAEQLQRGTHRIVRVADDGMIARPNHIYLAPGDGHLTIAPVAGSSAIVIDRAPMASGIMPSVDPMLLSLANHYRADMCAIILTGMGRDGLEGARRLRAQSGMVLAQ